MPSPPDAGGEASIGHHRDFERILGRDRAGGVGDFGRGGGGFRLVGKDADGVGAAAEEIQRHAQGERLVVVHGRDIPDVAFAACFDQVLGEIGGEHAGFIPHGGQPAEVFEAGLAAVVGRRVRHAEQR